MGSHNQFGTTRTTQDVDQDKQPRLVAAKHARPERGTPASCPTTLAVRERPGLKNAWSKKGRKGFGRRCSAEWAARAAPQAADPRAADSDPRLLDGMARHSLQTRVNVSS